jgi:hypothetical protein
LRYTPDHKQETRRRIIASAARRFRDEGYGPASVADIMGDAGLTHGGLRTSARRKSSCRGDPHAADDFHRADTTASSAPEWLEIRPVPGVEQHRGDCGGMPSSRRSAGEVALGKLPRPTGHPWPFADASPA